jgi:dienelactone hydrolase
MSERALLFGNEVALLGITTDPSPAAAARHHPGIVMLNAGLLPREGPNRLYVKLARTMARHGHAAMRFDFSGVGDSPNRTDDLPYEMRPVVETQAAMDSLTACSGASEYVLLGVCSGADAALQTAFVDPRVVGAILVNPTEFRRQATAKPLAPAVAQELTAHTHARVRMRYYTSRLLDARSWIRLVRGRSDRGAIWRTLRTLLRRWKMGDDVGRAAAQDCWNILQRGTDLLVVFSEGSPSWDLFQLARMEPMLRALGPTPGRLQVESIDHTDHVFTPLRSQQLLLQLVERWLEERTACSGGRQQPAGGGSRAAGHSQAPLSDRGTR